MDNDHAPIPLAYETPPPAARGFARTPLPVVVLLAVLVPGLSSSLIRRSAWRCLCLAPVIHLAFLFFGPFWGEVLFRSTPWSELGLYPFVLTCVVVEVVSVLSALDDRQRALRRVTTPTPCAPPRRAHAGRGGRMRCGRSNIESMADMPKHTADRRVAPEQAEVMAAPLDYAPPKTPEPLGRWFLRRLVMFPIILAAVCGVLALAGRVLVHFGWLDSLSQN